MQCTAALQRAPRRRLRPRSAFVAHSPLPQGSVTDSFSSPVLSRLLQELVSPLPDLLAPLCVILRGHHNHSLSLCHAPATPAPLYHHQTAFSARQAISDSSAAHHRRLHTRTHDSTMTTATLLPLRRPVQLPCYVQRTRCSRSHI